eukprot:75803_1
MPKGGYQQSYKPKPPYRSKTWNLRSRMGLSGFRQPGDRFELEQYNKGVFHWSFRHVLENRRQDMLEKKDRLQVWAKERPLTKHELLSFYREERQFMPIKIELPRDRRSYSRYFRWIFAGFVLAHIIVRYRETYYPLERVPDKESMGPTSSVSREEYLAANPEYLWHELIPEDNDYVQMLMQVQLSPKMWYRRDKRFYPSKNCLEDGENVRRYANEADLHDPLWRSKFNQTIPYGNRVSTVHAKRKNIPETRFERSSKNARAQLMHHHGIHEDPSGSPVFSDPNDGAMEEPRFHDDEG